MNCCLACVCLRVALFLYLFVYFSVMLKGFGLITHYVSLAVDHGDLVGRCRILYTTGQGCVCAHALSEDFANVPPQEHLHMLCGRPYGGES